MAVRRGGRIVPRAEKKSIDLKKNSKNIDNKVLVVAQEIKFAKILAGNDKRSRDKVLRHLKKWLTYRSSSTYEFTEQDFMRLWKGLFYCVWMSDKPLVQEELCENISKLFECFGSDQIETCILFYKCFLSTLATDWFGIDQHRLDKFLMFVRRMTRGVLKCLEQQKWSTKSLKSFNECLTGDGGIFSVDHPKLCLGLQMHLVDCWIEEVAKVSQGDISAKAVVALTKPFAQFLCYGEETRLASSITRNVFIHLVRQTDIGIEYQERLHAWKCAGFPGGSVDAMERVEIENDNDMDDSEDDQSDSAKRNLALDPRAGNVDTELPQLPVDGNLFSSMLKKLMADNRSTKGNRDKLRNLAVDFETLASGSYPYKMKNVVLENDPKFKLPKIQRTALDLLEYEENMKLENEDDEMRGMNKRQRRKYLMKQRKLLETGLQSDEEEDGDENNIQEPKRKQKNPPPPKKAKKKADKADSGVWTVENVEEPESLRLDSNLTSAMCDAGEDKKVKKSKKTSVQGRLSNGSATIQSKNRSNLKMNDSETNGSQHNSSPPQSSDTIHKSVKKTRKSTSQGNQSFINSTPMKSQNSSFIKKNNSRSNISLDSSSSSQKKVMIALKKNTSQGVMDYFKSVKQSPEIPFDGERKPLKTSLKPNAMPSPINPFYKKKLKLNF